MMHAFGHAVWETREQMAPLLRELASEPGSGGKDDMSMFLRYTLETGPDDTPEVLGEILGRTAAGLGGELMTSGERLRQEGRDEMLAIAEQRHREGRLEGQREGQMETIDGLLRTGVDWSVIERATGMDEEEYRKLKSDRNGGSADRGGQGRV